MDVAGSNLDRRVALPSTSLQSMMINGSSSSPWPCLSHNLSPLSLLERSRTGSGSSCDSADSGAFGRAVFDVYASPSPAAVGASVAGRGTGLSFWNNSNCFTLHRTPEEFRNLLHPWEIPACEPEMTSCVGNGSIVNNGRMDIFLTNMLQSTGLGSLEGQTARLSLNMKCTGCSLYRAVGKCQDCAEILCRQCVSAHLRSRLTKDHFVTSLPEDSSNSVAPQSPFPNACSSPNSINLSPVSPHCDIHHCEINLYCENCNKPVCRECVSRIHRGHNIVYLKDVLEETRMRSARMLTEAQNGLRAMQTGIDKIAEMSQKVEKKFVEVQKEVSATARQYIMAIEERERCLLNQLERITQMKGKALLLQMESLKSIRHRLAGCIDLLSKELDNGPALGLLKVADQVSAELHQIRSLHTSLCPCEDDLFTFIQPDALVFRAIQNFGGVKCSGYAGATEIQGRVPRTAPSGKISSFVVRVRNHLKELHGFGPEMLTALLVQPDGISVISADITDQGDGLYKISFCPQVEGDHALHVRLRGKSIPHSPFKINVRACRSYKCIGKPLLCFGSEGEEDGMLCRPWGICCNKEGQLIVADRSNNRIQVFDSNGKFVFKFGTQGSDPGQFDRPAGVATDQESNIIVADKDNHRIQIFTRAGQHWRMFGEKGTKPGQFNYPWDVAVNSDGDIIVSDTRNHRIQMFRSDGTFVTKYGFEGSSNMWKHFDSPRGVSFMPNGSIIVTDFNNHRLVVIEPNFSNARFLGGEGSGPKQFLRPQGIVVDDDGYIIVADSRNHRIQIFDTDGSIVSQFGTPGENVGELDRPSGICVTSDGKIAVVDFGNNRVQVF